MADRKTRKLVYPKQQAYWVLGDSSPALNAALETFADLIGVATADLESRLSRAEWNYCADMLNGCMSFGHPLGGMPSMFALSCTESNRLEGLGEKWSVDAKVLTKKLDELSENEAAALLFTVRFFWDCHESIDCQRDEWWTLKFRREVRSEKLEAANVGE